MKKLLIIIFLLQTVNSFSSQAGVTILSERIWTTGKIKAYIDSKKDNKDFTVLQVGVFSNLPNFTLNEGIQTKVWSGHKYYVFNTEGYDLTALIEGKFCYNGDNCAYVERDIKIVNYSTADDSLYISVVIEGLKPGAYPMQAETKLTLNGIKVYTHNINRSLVVKPFPYD